MAAEAVDRTPRIAAAEVRQRMEAREFVTILDVRAFDAYDGADRHIRGDLRVDPDDLHILPTLPKDQLTVAYCA